MEEKVTAYLQKGVTRIVYINLNQLYYKDLPSKDKLYTFRCRIKDFNYYIKIDKLNLETIQRKENEIDYKEFKSHSVRESKEVN